MLNKENFKNDKDDEIQYLNILIIKCKYCGIQISTSKLELPLDYNNGDSFIKINKNNLVFISTGKKEKLSKDKSYVYSKVKCMNCRKKLGRLIILGDVNVQLDIQKCILKTENIIIEKEKERLNENYLIVKKQCQNFYNSNKINEKLMNYVKVIFDNTCKICEDCIEELNSFVNLQDYLINNGQKIEKYFLDLNDKIKNKYVNKKDIKQFLTIINKNNMKENKNNNNNNNSIKRKYTICQSQNKKY